MAPPSPRIIGDPPCTKYNTQNGLSSNAKTVSVGALNARLADAIDLALLTKQAHWNIKGPQFIALHEMIDGFRTEIDTHVDTMAERIAYCAKTPPAQIHSEIELDRTSKVATRA